MKYHQCINTVTKITDIIQGAGAKVPKPVTDGLAKLEGLAAKVNALTTDDRLAAAVLDALDSDVDPFSAPAVQAAVARRTIAGYAVGLEDELNRRAQALMNATADSLLAALRDPFEQAAVALVSAHQELGDVDLDDTASVLSRGGTAARAWANAQEADRTVQRVSDAWASLGLAVRSIGWDPQWRLLTIAEVPADEMLEARRHGRTFRPWDILREGWTLSLATPETLPQRIGDVLDAQLHGASAGADAFAAEMRRKNPPILIR